MINFLLGFGWILFAALYVIGFIYTVTANIASYSDPMNFLKWRWRWSLLAWPLLMLSDAWDSRASVMRALRKI